MCIRDRRNSSRLSQPPRVSVSCIGGLCQDRSVAVSYTHLVVAGGHSSFNPEPIADFVDAVVVGDGEQAVLALTDLVGEWKAQGRPGGRAELLLRIARSGVAYVPSCYEVSYLPDGRIQRVAPKPGLTGIPWRVAKHTVTDLDACLLYTSRCV